MSHVLTTRPRRRITGERVARGVAVAVAAAFAVVPTVLVGGPAEDAAASISPRAAAATSP